MTVFVLFYQELTYKATLYSLIVVSFKVYQIIYDISIEFIIQNFFNQLIRQKVFAHTMLPHQHFGYFLPYKKTLFSQHNLFFSLVSEKNTS